jgi:cell division protein FtsB
MKQVESRLEVIFDTAVFIGVTLVIVIIIGLAVIADKHRGQIEALAARVAALEAERGK